MSDATPTLRNGTVDDIPDAELLARAVKRARSNKRLCVPAPRWSAVMDAFGLGSTYAHQLCVRFDLDPEEIVVR